MPFTKITETDLQNKGVIGLPDTPGLSTTEMQEKFDEIALDVLTPKHNGLIDELALSSAAANIGALDVNNEASTVQAELNKLKQGGYTKAETDALLANKVDTQSGKGLSTNDFTDAYKDKLNGIEDNANNYVLPKGTQSTIGGVMGDGTTFTIDSNGVGHAVGGGGGGTPDYSALVNKPSINHVELIGDKDGSEFGFLSPVITITSDAGSTVKIKKGTTEIDAVPVTTTTWKAVPSDYGTWTVSSTLPGADEATGTVTVDAVKQYSVTVEHITATITATYPNDATYCTCSKGSTTYTATSNPQTFTVRATGTWTVETSLNGVVKSATTTITADGDSQSVTIEYADIEVTYDNNFKGKTITCTNGTLTYTKTAPSDANTVTFTIPSTGTWTVRSEVSGVTYSQNVSVLSYTSYSASLAVFNATITITFPYSNGATCTCNSETATSSPYTFNIGATGTYTATCTLDGVSKTQSFTITTDGQTETHTFEYGTINLTFDNEFRGLTLTCTDSSYTITKTAPSTGNTMVFYPNETNTWTISGTYSGVTYTTTAEVSSLSTPVSAILQTIPDGSTVTPTDVIQTWLKCAAINDKNYTTLAQVLADTDTFTALLQDSNACDYMARSTTWANKGLVPKMTSNTTPSGETILYNTSSTYTSTAYKAFDGDINTYAEGGSSSGTPAFGIGYHFTSPVCVKGVVFHGRSNMNTQTAYVQGSNDNSTWDDLATFSLVADTETFISLANNTTSYSYYRVAGTNYAYGGAKKLQFYENPNTSIVEDADAMSRVGKYDYCSCALLGNSTWASAIVGSAYWESVLTDKVPTMTSNTTPSGVASASSEYSSTYVAWKAFDNDISSAWIGAAGSSWWIRYEFDEPIKVKKFTFNAGTDTHRMWTGTKVQASNDGTTWEDIYSDNITVAINTDYVYPINNDSYYKYYQVVISKSGASDGSSPAFTTLQFYGRTEAQTNIIHSAASDTLYYIDGTNQTIGTTDTSGVGTVNWSNLPVGTMTVYSTVANEPTDLTSAYSRTIRITPHTTEVYVMPDVVKTPYWFGYKSSSLKNCDDTFDAMFTGGQGFTSETPTYNTNYITLAPSAGNKMAGVYVENVPSGSTPKVISQATSSIDAYYPFTKMATAKSQAGTTETLFFTTTYQVQTLTTLSAVSYFVVGTAKERCGNLYAMWYE